MIPRKLFSIILAVLSEAQYSFLQKDLNFSIPPKKINDAS